MMRDVFRPQTARNAFTIVEILVVVALVLVLLSIIVVAVGSATRTAQRANTSALMGSIKQAMTHFESDVGYLPPVLDHQRSIRFELPNKSGQFTTNGPNPDWNAAGWDENRYRNEIQEWWSITTIAEYLIGYGPEGEDGHSGPGIRHPGPDGFWGATINHGLSGTPGQFQYRTTFLADVRSQSYRQGRVYGPYLQLRDDRLLGAIDPSAPPNSDGNVQVFFPGEAGYNDAWPKVVVDYWGQPIRYYRKPHPPNSINRAYRQVYSSSDPRHFEVPTLADVFVLRPWDLRSGAGMDTRFRDENSFEDRTATAELMSAEFALFSSGPDRRLSPDVRWDELFNRDNIVELGP